MKGKRLHTRRLGVCKVGEQVFFFAETSDTTYYVPAQSEQAMDPYLHELKQYLVLKYGQDTAEAFLDYGLKRGAEEYFDSVGGELDRPQVIADVDEWLES